MVNKTIKNTSVGVDSEAHKYCKNNVTDYERYNHTKEIETFIKQLKPKKFIQIHEKP